MARYLLILFLFAPVKLIANKHLFLLTQKEQTFRADGDLWMSFFSNYYKQSVIVLRPIAYTRPEVLQIFDNYVKELTSADTLIMVVSAHTVRNGNCTLLQFPVAKDIMQLIVFRTDYENFLSVINTNGVRTLLIINSCEPFTVFNTSLVYRYKNLTMCYADERYSIFRENEGSLMAILSHLYRFRDTKTWLEWLNGEYMDNANYYGVDKTLHVPITDFYPQQSTFYGLNYEF